MDSYEGSNEAPLSLHKYLYANADGVNKIDPSGNITLGERLQVLAINYTLVTLTTLSNGAFFLSRNIDRLEYWWNWLEIGFTGAEVVGDIASETGAIQFDVPNSSQTGRTGDRGEEIWIRELENKGFSRIIQLQNNSNQGIDVFAVDPKGTMHYFEVKSTVTNSAPSMTPDQRNERDFIRSRLERAAGAVNDPHWTDNNVSADVRAEARRLLDDFNNEVPYQASKVNVYLPRSSSTVGNFFARIRLGRWGRRSR